MISKRKTLFLLAPPFHLLLGYGTDHDEVNEVFQEEPRRGTPLAWSLASILIIPLIDSISIFDRNKASDTARGTYIDEMENPEELAAECLSRENAVINRAKSLPVINIDPLLPREDMVIERAKQGGTTS